MNYMINSSQTVRCTWWISVSGQPSSFVFSIMNSSASFATSCSASLRCTKVSSEVYFLPSTNKDDLNLGACGKPSLTV